MKKLLMLLAAGMLLAVSVGCAYTGAVSDPTGKLYISRVNLNGLWNSFFTCEPSGGNLNCKEATLLGTGAPASSEPAPATEAKTEAEGAGDAATDTATEATE